MAFKLLRVPIVVFLICFIISLFQTSGANITVPLLELYTRGTLGDSSLDLETEGELDLRVEGGYKFGGRVVLGFDSSSLEQDFINRITETTIAGTGLTFKSASVVIHDLFSTSLAFTFFIGENDTLAFGEDFSDIFGTERISTNYCGFLYFPEGIRYEGIHRIAGTGIKLEADPIIDKLHMALYMYQDGYFYEPVAGPPPYTFDPGHYSADFRLLLNLNKIKLETFLGATFPASDYGYYRWGILFHAADKGGEFLAQLGIPRLDPNHDTMNLGLFYLLFEARLFLGIFSIIPTVFLHPGYYQQIETDESGLLDINLKLHLGRIESLINGGLETNLAFTKENLQGLEIKVSPYISFITPGVVWQLKVNTKVFPFSYNDMFEGFIGIKAEF